MRNENVSESIDTSLYFIEIMSFYFSNIYKAFTGQLFVFYFPIVK